MTEGTAHHMGKQVKFSPHSPRPTPVLSHINLSPFCSNLRELGATVWRWRRK